MHTKTFTILVLSLLFTACFNPISKNDEPTPGIVNQQPNPDTQPKLDKQQYFRLKPNTGDAFVKSLQTYLSSSLSENYYYRNSGATEFDNANTSGGGGGAGSAGTGTAPTAGASSDAASSSSSISGTNLIEQGVDEADLIKSDGQFLYVARNQRNYYGGQIGIGATGTTAIVTDTGTLTKEVNEPPSILIYAIDNTTPQANPIASIILPLDTNRIHGLYLNKDTQSTNNQLVVISNAILNKQSSYQDITRVTTYEVSDPTAPTISWTLDIDGSSISTRLLNGKLLLITRQYLDLNRLIEPYVTSDVKAEIQQAIAKITVNDVLPKTRFNTELISLVDATDCIVPISANEQSYFDSSLTTIFTIPLTNPQAADSICTLESSGEIYVSPKALYLTKNDYLSDTGEGTLIHKFALNDSGLAYRASGRIPGTIGWRNNAFRMSEHNDYFRVVTSISEPYNQNIGAPIWRGNEQTHHLFILKEDKTSVGQLTIISQLPNDTQTAAIGKPGEQIYGVRFNQNYGYVVTFKKVDPLYVLNLADPEAPFIEGELELPGYSDYLHPVNENILIGIGKDAVEENGTAFYQGIKVGIFDISDKTNPQVIQEAIIGNRGTNSPALSDHHAFTYFNNTDTGIIRFAFPVSIHGGEPAYYNKDSASTYYNWQSSGLQLFALSENNGIFNLSNDGVITVATANSGGTNTFNFEEPRALFVDDAVFLADKEEVWASNWYTPETVTTTVNQETISFTGYLSFIIGDSSSPGAGPIYHMSISDPVGNKTFDIEYPSAAVDTLMSQTSPFAKLVTATGIVISAPGETPRKIRLSSIVLAE